MSIQSVFAIVFVVVFAGTSLFAFVNQMTQSGVLGALSSWRANPRRAAIVFVELGLVVFAAAMYVGASRWTAVMWWIVGLVAAGLMLYTIRISSQSRNTSDLTDPPKAPEVKYRTPRPAPGSGESHLSDESGGGDVGSANNAPDGGTDEASRMITYQGVCQWQSPVPEDYRQRVLAWQHALVYRGRVPQPAALCGYRYDLEDLPREGTAAIWGLGIPKSKRCPKCTQGLREAGYELWNIDQWALGR